MLYLKFNKSSFFLSLWTSKQEKLSQEVPFVFRNMTLYKNYKGISINQTKMLLTGKTTMTKNDDLKKKNALKSYQNLHHTRSCENSPILENIITAISEKYIYSIRLFTFNEFTLSWVFVVNIRMHDANTCTQYLIITIWTHHWRPPLNPPPLFHKEGLREETGTNFCELSETWAVY